MIRRTEDGIEMSIVDVVRILKENILIIILCTIIAGVCAGGYRYMHNKKQVNVYASTSIIQVKQPEVVNLQNLLNNISNNINQEKILDAYDKAKNATLKKELVGNYKTIINSKSFLESINEDIDSEKDIEITDIKDSEMLTISVKNKDAEVAQEENRAIINKLQEYVASDLKIENTPEKTGIYVIEPAQKAVDVTKGISYKLVLLFTIVVGFMGSCALVVAKEIVNFGKNNK